MFELFFDLVFVYAISRITAMIYHPVNGGILLATFLEFLLVVVVVMEIWLYQVVYFNRYSKNNFLDFLFVVVVVMEIWLYQVVYFNRYIKNNFLDIAGLVLNMFTAVYLANNINTEWRITFHYFNIAMVVMIATIFCQYLFTSVNETNDKREFLFILGIEFLLVILGLVLGYSVGIYFCIAAYIIGLVL